MPTVSQQNINEAQSVANQAATNASQLNFGQSLRQELYTSSQSIQDLLDILLQNGGVLTPTQSAQLDEEMRLAKKRLLESETKITIQRYALIGGIGLISLSILWYLTRK